MDVERDALRALATIEGLSKPDRYGLSRYKIKLLASTDTSVVVEYRDQQYSDVVKLFRLRVDVEEL